MDKIDRVKPHIPGVQSLLNSFKDILETGQMIQGKKVQQFEQIIADYVGTDYAVATNSCGAALEITLSALPSNSSETGRYGKEWIVPTQTFPASVSAIIRSGWNPRITEVDPVTQCLNADIILNNINPMTRGVLLVTMAGLIPPDIEKIQKICRDNKLFLVTDDAHSLGSRYDAGSKSKYAAGNLGIAGCFSFYPTKIITTGEGGMVTTNSKSLYEKLLVRRNHGVYNNVTKIKDPIPGKDYGVTCTFPSQNFRMTEIAATIGISQMKHIDNFISRRNDIADMYTEAITKIPGIDPPPTYDGIRQTWWQYMCQANHPELSRNEICEHLTKKYDIPTARPYKPACHEQPAFKPYMSLSATEHLKYPVSEALMDRHFSLPMHPGLTNEQVEYVCESLKDVVDTWIVNTSAL